MYEVLDPSQFWNGAQVDSAAIWYEKMIEARDVFAVVFANSPYTEELRASPHGAT
jgi:hypothetical protein